MAEITLTLDASEYIKVFNAGMEYGFMLAINGDTPELDKELNVNSISEATDNDE